MSTFLSGFRDMFGNTCTIYLLLCIYFFGAPFGVCDKTNNIICIGKDKPATFKCSTFHSNLTAANLELSLQDNTAIIFTDQNLIIQETINIEKKENIEFIGLGRSLRGGSTYLHCTDSTNSGIQFTHVTNLVIENLTLINCGGLFGILGSENKVVKTALALSECRNVDIKNLKVESSAGTGMVMSNCIGVVRVYNSSFENNPNVESLSFQPLQEANGGGLYIESYNRSKDAIYQIEKSQFLNNSLLRLDDRSLNYLLGGGMSILAVGQSNNITFNISDCLFDGNSAEYGGGIHLLIKKNSSNIHIFMNHVNVSNNSATSSGGGLDIAIDILRSISDNNGFPRNNKVIISYCNFEGNEAGYAGGGAAFFSGLVYSENPYNEVTFKSCFWKRNIAAIGSGLSIIPVNVTHVFNTLPPSIVLSDTTFQHNMVKGIINKIESTLYCRLMPITVNNTIKVESNRGSGISLVDSAINVKQNGVLMFTGNNGSFGGGIFMIGLSKIIVDINVTMNFSNNRASFRGGAIFFYSLHELFSIDIHTCFIQHNLITNSSLWPTLYFNNNKASLENSHSIFVSSLTNCNCPLNSSSDESSVFDNCIGRFIFDDANITSQVATIGSKFSKTNNTNTTAFHAIPGKTMQLPFNIQDQLGHNTTALLLLAINKQSSKSSLSLLNSITANNEAVFSGMTDDEGNLQINSFFQNLSLEINVVVTECPPGYINVNSTCICSAHVPDEQYQSLIQCDYNDMKSSIINGFWAGYVTDGEAEKPGENNLYVSECPFGYCYDISNVEELSYKTKLTEEASQEKLDDIICKRQKRTGILCGECIEGHTIYYHSRKYSCGPRKQLCNYGIVIYFLCEIIPVTFLFTLVILKGVNFNSGTLNGFVLFAQLIQSISIVANGTIRYKKAEFLTYELVILMYQPFNLNFFETEALSFCIYKRANFLVIIFIKLITLLYSLALVIVLVYIMRSRYCYKLQISCFKSGITKTSSLTSGMAAFFTLCYSNATRLSFDILNAGQLIGKGNVLLYPLRVFRMGNVIYFSGVHIPFGIGAILILLTIVLIPPLLLFIYPVGVTVLPEKVKRISFFRYISWKAGLYMTLFDSFQGCFKDKHRYFAGLYFLYRSAFLATFAYLQSTIIFLLTNQMIISVVLSLHLWVQPYKKSIHNLIDGALFLILAMINLLTIWRYFKTYTAGGDEEILVVGIIQLILLFIPALVFSMCTLYLILPIKKFARVFKSKLRNIQADGFQSTTDNYSSLDNIDSRLKEEWK